MVIGLLHIWDEGVELGLVVRDCVGWIKNLTMFGNILESELLNKTVI